MADDFLAGLFEIFQHAECGAEVTAFLGPHDFNCRVVETLMRRHDCLKCAVVADLVNVERVIPFAQPAGMMIG